MDTTKPQKKHPPRTAAQTKAEARYRQKRVGKTVFFNPDKEQHLINVIESMDNYAGWLKGKLEEYLKEKQSVE